MRIAVVDDDSRVMALLTKYIAAFFRETAYVQDDFSNGAEFIESLSEYEYNIVFMDIEMNCMNGEEAVKILRKQDINENVFVVFVSSHTNNLTSLFSLRPFDFITKPFSYDDVNSILSAIMSKINTRNGFITITTNRQKYKLSVNDIMYINSDKHKLIIFLQNNKTLEAYMKLTDIEAELNAVSSDFLQIHKSFIVNRKYIKQYKRESIVIGDATLNISRQYQDSIMLSFRENS